MSCDFPLDIGELEMIQLFYRQSTNHNLCEITNCIINGTGAVAWYVSPPTERGRAVGGRAPLVLMCPLTGRSKMAHLWTREKDNDWRAVALRGETVALGGHPPGPVDAGGVAVVRRTSAGRNRWLLLVPPDAPVRVNGVPVRTGVRMLRDRDSIGLGGSPNIFFSTERLAVAAPQPEGERATCARCKTTIDVGSPAVECPQCGARHHQSDDLPCWNYAARCSRCERLSEDAGYRWTPEAL